MGCRLDLAVPILDGRTRGWPCPYAPARRPIFGHNRAYHRRREGCDRSGGTGMRTVVIALASVAILTAPAYAQMRGKGGKHSGSEQQTVEQKQKAAEAEKAYRAALDRIPDKKKSDPWGNVR